MIITLAIVGATICVLMGMLLFYRLKMCELKMKNEAQCQKFLLLNESRSQGSAREQTARHALDVAKAFKAMADGATRDYA